MDQCSDYYRCLEHSRTNVSYVCYVNNDDCEDVKCQYDVIQCIVNVACGYTTEKCAIDME